MAARVASCAVAMPGKDGAAPLIWLSLGGGGADITLRLEIADAEGLHLQLGAALGSFARARALSAEPSERAIP